MAAVSRWRLVGLGLAAWLAAIACGAPPEEAAPVFTLPALDGGQVSLEALRGRPVVVDFWATWCDPCVRQIPILGAFQESHPEVVVLGVSVDVAGEEGLERKITRWAAAQEIAFRYRILLGSPELGDRWGVVGYPSLFVIGPDGVIDSIHQGVATVEQLEEAVDRAVAAAGT